ncbi:MAG: RnfH family protein [Burkholderiales bacterium]|nr:RnfH family protein [Burkholderiales bacterium]MDQ3195098.1 RnfH family protein [Pseudomonadota bacterium]
MRRPNEALITVEIVYATVDAQTLIAMQVEARTTAAQAIAQCGILRQHPEIAKADIGIFGRPVRSDTVLRDHDRIEIYRPLINDPKHQRQSRARSSLKR